MRERTQLALFWIGLGAFLLWVVVITLRVTVVR